MPGLALLFPGQASQAVGMGADLRRQHQRAREIFELADQVSELLVSRLCEEGPLEQLTETRAAQAAVVATSLAALAVLRAELGSALAPTAAAGHSVGELAAYAAAGALDEPTALRLVAVRSRAMAAACAEVHGGMAAVLGLDEAPLQAVCDQATHEGSSVEIANLNAPGQLVISGEMSAIERARPLAVGAGARRVLPLNVAGPFHSRYMRPAAEQLGNAVRQTQFARPQIHLVGNVRGGPLEDRDLSIELIEQVASPVRWMDVLRTLSAFGCDRFLEVGHGQVIAGLVKRTLPDARVTSFGSPADFPAVESLLA